MTGIALERKTMTVVFTDIVKSTAHAREHEEWFIEHRNADLEEFARLVEKWRGRVVKDLGDGLLSVFDSAADAMRCAIEMQAWADERRRKRDDKGRHVAGANPDALLHRIGVHTGEVYPRGTDISGDAVNLAKRYEENAWWNGIHYSEVVRQTIAPSIKGLQPKTFFPFYFKGIDEPLRTYLIPSNLGALQMPPPDWRGPKPTPVITGPEIKPTAGEKTREWFRERRRSFVLTTAVLGVAIGGFCFHQPIAQAITTFGSNFKGRLVSQGGGQETPANLVIPPPPIHQDEPVSDTGGTGGRNVPKAPPKQELPAAPIATWWQAAARSYDYAGMAANYADDRYRLDAAWRQAKANVASLQALRTWAEKRVQGIERDMPLHVSYPIQIPGADGAVQRDFRLFFDNGRLIVAFKSEENQTVTDHPDGPSPERVDDAYSIEMETALFPATSGGEEELSARDHIEIFKALNPSANIARDIAVFQRIHRAYGPE
ncbi:hypothetical protein BH11ARM2_BH11ARM2_21610 [soil metagenome]